ncbi:MAG: type II toxin-antitoxin system HipA family toxin [Deltaproteobacteria bacterium]|nr:type II toxin-antitoxin system HipA family toxin [Deltaproteobacteria bacterium]
MLKVWHETEPVGTIIADKRRLQFTYDPAWLKADAAFPLSPRLPLRPEPYDNDPVALFFSNLLPEGPVLSAILKLKQIPAGDLYAQLEALGEDAAGAFSITPGGVKRTRKASYAPYSPAMIRADIERLGKRLPLLAQHGELRLSLAGAQDKIPVKWDGGKFSLPKDGAASTHILKPAIQPVSDIPESVENEAFCLALAARAGLNAVGAETVRLPPDVLVIRRYDRTIEKNRIRRLHQLDFCQLAGVLPDQKYQRDGGPGFKDIFDLINQHTTVPGVDQLKVIDWVIFNFLIGNADAHGKNLALLAGEGGRMRLAPFYDLLSTAVYRELDPKMAMSIGGEYRAEWVHEKHWRKFAADVKVMPSLLKKRSAELAARVMTEAPNAAGQLGLPASKGIIRKIILEIRRRAGWLEAHQEGL